MQILDMVLNKPRLNKTHILSLEMYLDNKKPKKVVIKQAQGVTLRRDQDNLSTHKSWEIKMVPVYLKLLLNKTIRRKLNFMQVIQISSMEKVWTIVTSKILKKMCVFWKDFLKIKIWRIIVNYLSIWTMIKLILVLKPLISLPLYDWKMRWMSSEGSTSTSRIKNK